MSDLDFRDRIILVQGVKVAVKAKAAAIGSDIDKESARVAAMISYWGSVKGSAIEEEIMADAYYRSWRAKKKMEVLQAERGLSESKVMARVESDPKFAKLKAAMAICERNVAIAESQIRAFDKKANLLQSRQANLRTMKRS